MYGYTLVNSQDLKKLDYMLSDEQRAIYDKIKKERLHHFYMGLGCGALLGLFIILSNVKIFIDNINLSIKDDRLLFLLFSL